MILATKRKNWGRRKVPDVVFESGPSEAEVWRRQLQTETVLRPSAAHILEHAAVVTHHRPVCIRLTCSLKNRNTRIPGVNEGLLGSRTSSRPLPDPLEPSVTPPLHHDACPVRLLLQTQREGDEAAPVQPSPATNSASVGLQTDQIV